MDIGDCLVRRALSTAKKFGPIDCLVFLGDLVQDGSFNVARQAWESLRDIAKVYFPNTPLLAIPGNHDVIGQKMLDIFGSPTELTVDGYRLVGFVDPYDKDDVSHRCEREFARLAKEAAEYPGRLVVLQHNPMNPVIQSNYPYMLKNRHAVMNAYAQAGVLLSLSGHYHPGQELTEVDGVKYFTAPALCQVDQFAFTLVDILGSDNDVEIKPQNFLLFLGDREVCDMHCHTQLAYCAEDITVEKVIQRCCDFGLAGMGFAEHSPHLYVSHSEFEKLEHILKPDTWKAAKNGRMLEYREMGNLLRSNFVKFGFEVELDIDGNLILHEEDRQWADYLIGAVHFLLDLPSGATDAERNNRFLVECERLLAYDVDILAHPFRWFVRNAQQPPHDLFKPLAKMLHDTDTAAEINFHTNQPPRRFFEICRDMGVKILYGSDAHALYEAGNILANIKLLD